MAFQLRDVKELAEEVGGSAKAKALLSKAGLHVMDGFYNHGAFEAITHYEPTESNIGRSATSSALWTISPHDGIGAIKSLIDKLNLDITHHQYHQTNYVVLRNKRKQRLQVKIYSTAYYCSRHERARFSVSGFTTNMAPPVYMFACFQGPVAWVVTRKQLASIHNKCWKSKDSSIEIEHTVGDRSIVTTFRIPKGRKKKGRGYLTCTFHPQDSYRLLRAKQFNL
jgi:hypothetical protein